MECLAMEMHRQLEIQDAKQKREERLANKTRNENVQDKAEAFKHIDRSSRQPKTDTNQMNLSENEIKVIEEEGHEEEVILRVDLLEIKPARLIFVKEYKPELS